MEKFKIEEIFSKEYEEGRVDRFFLSGRIDIHNQLISFLRLLNISEEKLEELDFVTSDAEGYFFVFDREIRVSLLISEEGINLIMDTKIPKEELISKIENYFQVL